MLFFLSQFFLAALCDPFVIEAKVSEQFVEGHVTCVVARTAENVRIATYPRTLDETTALDDLNRLRFYPEGYDKSFMQLWYQDKELEGEGAWQTFGTVHQGEKLTLNFKTRIPQHRGTFGMMGHSRFDRTLHLLGGWHPVLSDTNELLPTTIQYRIEVLNNTVGFVGNTPFGLSSSRLREGSLQSSQLPLLLAPQARIETTDHAIVIVPKTIEEMPDISSGRNEAALTELLKTLRLGEQQALRAGLTLKPYLVVLTPLREHLIETFDLGLAVSDRAFHTLAWERMRKFHRFSIWREQLSHLAKNTALKNILPHHMLAEIVGSALKDNLQETYGTKEYVPDVLEPIAITPEIDALIFAPQIPFTETYYNALLETQDRKRKPQTFCHSYANGHLVYEKLVALLGYETVQKTIFSFLKNKQGFLQTLADTSHYDKEKLRTYLLQWLKEYPVVDYFIEDIKDHTITLGVQGPDAHKIIEPLSVKVKDRKQTQTLQRLGPGAIVVETPYPIQSVELDPEHRLVELWHLKGETARFNNRDPKRLRLLLNDVSGLFAVTNKQLTLSADFLLRRIDDQKYRLNFIGLYAPQAIGASVRFTRAFGREVTALRLAQALSVQTDYRYLRPEKRASNDGYEIKVVTSYDVDTRLSPYSSFTGNAIRLDSALAVGQTDKTFVYAQLGFGLLKLWNVTFNQALVTRLSGDIILGDAPPQVNLRLGGRYLGARGFELNEAVGKKRMIASSEYRHTLSADSYTDIGGLFAWTRTEGAFFADAVWLPVERSGCDQQMFYDVGYGVRFLGEILNISPASLAFDLGVPINRCQDERNRFPIAVYVSFVQSFLVF